MTHAGVRRRRSNAPRMEPNGDGSILRYNVSGIAFGTFGTIGLGATRRLYIAGFNDTGSDLIASAGNEITSYYSSARFLPGTRIKWEPSCSFTTTGRVFVGFTDNPEVARSIWLAQNTFRTSGTVADYNAFANQIKAFGSTISFPVWQETDIPFPTKMRRKRFDIGETGTVLEDLDRTMQTAMFVAVEAAPGTGGPYILGNFWYHDVVDVEGLHSTAT